MFASTQVCECSFSDMKFIKKSHRSSQKNQNLFCLMKVGTSTEEEINFEQLVHGHENDIE